MIRNPRTGALETFSFELLQQNVPELDRFEFPIDTIQINPLLDSSDMDPDGWRKMVATIADNYDKYSGFVILHGTDTMAYSASALSFMLQGLHKPVIFTGAQLPAGALRTDADDNITASIEIAAATTSEGKPLVPEVCIYFENKLLRGNRTTKSNAEGFDAFASFNYPELATAGVHIRYNLNFVHPYAEGALAPQYDLDTNVAILKLFPGIQQNVVEALFSIAGLKAVVLETYGTGNAPTQPWLSRILRQAYQDGIVVVNISQCHEGWVEMTRYETGYWLQESGVVSGYDTTIESAITKLMFLLGQKMSPAEVRDRMCTSLAGEVTIS